MEDRWMLIQRKAYALDRSSVWALFYNIDDERWTIARHNGGNGYLFRAPTLHELFIMAERKLDNDIAAKQKELHEALHKLEFASKEV